MRAIRAEGLGSGAAPTWSAAEAGFGVSQRVLERSAAGRRGDLDPNLGTLGSGGVRLLKGVVQPRHDVASRACARLWQQDAEAGRGDSDGSIGVARLEPDQAGRLAGEAFEHLAPVASVELDQEHRRRSPVACVARRFVTEGDAPVRPRVELVRPPRAITLVDGELAPARWGRRAVEEGLDPSRRSLVVMVVRQHEARRSAWARAGGIVVLEMFCHGALSLASYGRNEPRRES